MLTQNHVTRWLDRRTASESPSKTANTSSQVAILASEKLTAISAMEAVDRVPIEIAEAAIAGIPAEDVKNRARLDADLGLVTSSLLRQYIDKHRQHALDAPSSALFPRRNGEPLDPSHFGEDLKKLVTKEIGLEIHAHLYRHFAAKVILEARPGDYETARRLLGHAKMDTTTGFYAGFNTRAAFKLYGSLLDGARKRRGKKGKT